MSFPADATTDRLVLFEVGSAAYALPIAQVIEVSEPGPPAGIPMLPRRVASVMNLHGDALPVVARGVLFEEPTPGFAEPAHVLVIGGGEHRSERIGLPVDRVLGIVAGHAREAAGPGLVVERRQVEGRIVAILDAERVIREALRAIEAQEQ